MHFKSISLPALNFDLKVLVRSQKGIKKKKKKSPTDFKIKKKKPNKNLRFHNVCGIKKKNYTVTGNYPVAFLRHMYFSFPHKLPGKENFWSKKYFNVDMWMNFDKSIFFGSIRQRGKV